MNFNFIKDQKDFKVLYKYCADAEDFIFSHPDHSGISSRKASEYVVKTIYKSCVNYTDENPTTFQMLEDERFRSFLSDDTIIDAMHIVRKLGNAATHEDDSFSSKDAIRTLETLHFIVGEVLIFMGVIDDYPVFKVPEINQANESENNLPNMKELKKEVVVEETVVAKYGKRMRETVFSVKHLRDERENKKLFIEAGIREADWKMVNKDNILLPESACLNCALHTGEKIDFILMGKDNKPLAVIDYTETASSIINGREKVKRVMEELKNKYGYLPAGYYTTGYRTYFIDPLGYSPREVYGFHTASELELIKFRKDARKDISDPIINDNITNRDYQKNAIKKVCEVFTDNRRKSLLVMATGTGKTRVAISLSEVLLKNHWVKNILFLADRTSLVKQAHKNFTKLLPGETTSVYAGSYNDKNPDARIIFSTYQTMISLINDESKEFGIGRFDLIIVDEAHRSIFSKYGSIFKYFDSLMVGLTATPRKEQDKNVYNIFQCVNGEPDFSYELEEAIMEGYLVGFAIEDKTTAVLRRGIKYSDLSTEDKKILEDAFEIDEKENDPNKYKNSVHTYGNKTINRGTIKAMLEDLMENGLKIHNGDKLGKTIIFSRSHQEAMVIVEEFNKSFSNLGKDFCKLIDSQVENSQSLIESFEIRDKMPQIVVSVDMMDTGIDVPDILNLVFFKKVNSMIKFLQMIGRGTRLSQDIFGHGLNKQGFLIFDYYDNCRYFSTRGTWNVAYGIGDDNASTATPQKTLINKRKLGIMINLKERPKEVLSDFEFKYMNDLKNDFVNKTRALSEDNILVNSNMSYVSKYRTEENWDFITDEVAHEIEIKIFPLFENEKAHVKTRNFDLLMYIFQDEYIKREEGNDLRKMRNGFKDVVDSITNLMVHLLTIKTIPEIMDKESLIKNMVNADYLFNDFSLNRCEFVRSELRTLMGYIPDDKHITILNVPDWIEKGETDSPINLKTYPQKALDYINTSNDPALSKIRNLDPLTTEEKAHLEHIFYERLGTQAEFIKWSNGISLLLFLRKQLGIDEQAFNVKFGSFLNEGILTKSQLDYCNQIIEYTKNNGDFSFELTQSVSPLCDVDIPKLFGTNITYLQTLIKGIHRVIL